MRIIAFIFLLTFASATASEVEIIYDPGLPSRGDTSKKNWHVDHGTIANILGDSVAKLRVRYYSERSWKSADEVRAHVKAVLQDEHSRTFEAPIWAQPFVTDIEAVIEFKDGKRGVWVMSGWTSCFQDSSGKYWFAVQQDLGKKRKELHNKPIAPQPSR